MAIKQAGKSYELERKRVLIGTDTEVVRVMNGTRKNFFWAVKEDDGSYRHVEKSETELK